MPSRASIEGEVSDPKDAMAYANRLAAAWPGCNMSIAIKSDGGKVKFDILMTAR